MNFLDRAISAIAPSVGLKRLQARAVADELAAHYDAAKRDRSFTGWLTSGADVHTVVAADVSPMRDRCRDLARNNPYVSRAYDVLVARMIGNGVRPRLPQSMNERDRTEALDLWNKWADEADLDGLQSIYALQAQAVRVMVESGMALVKYIPSTGEIPWKMQVLEPDYLDLDRNGTLDNGGAVINGVEFAADGTRVAYWLFRDHPGSGTFFRAEAERVDARYIAPLYREERPDQVIGVPWAAPIVTRARHLDDLADARLKRAKIQACFAGFIISDNAGDIDPATMARRKQLAPGAMEYLRPGEDIKFASPPSAEPDGEWVQSQLHAIAAGLGVTYAQMTGDLSRVNYSSLRAGTLDQSRLLEQWQRLMLVPMLLNPMWNKFDQIVASWQRRSVVKVEWDFPERELVDPLKDGQAIDEALRAGRRTFRDVISSSGRDPELHIAALKAEREELADLNLPHTTTTHPVEQIDEEEENEQPSV